MSNSHSNTRAIPNPPNVDASAPATVADAIGARRRALDRALARLQDEAATVAALAARIVAALRGGGRVLVAGNGGSAAMAQHFAAELMGRFKRERPPFAVLALTADTALLTAVANDYGYGDVFARQVRGLGQPGDVFLAFSTSGESENLISAANAAHARGMAVLAVTGERESRLARASDVTLRAPAADTALIQELHLIVTHLVCGAVEGALTAPDATEGEPR